MKTSFMGRPVRNRRRRVLIGTLLGIALMLDAGRFAPAMAGQESARSALDRALANVRAAGMPGLVADAGNGRWSWHGAAGVADLGTGRPMRASYESRMASVTKTFTAVGVLTLAAEGRIDLDELAALYLPGVIDGDRARHVTVRSLLNHTSGIGDYGHVYFQGDSKTANERMRVSANEPEDSARIGLNEPAPGPFGTFHYSNTNYILAGMIISRVTGVDAERYITEHVIKPAGLRHTYFPGRSPYIRGPHSRAYYREHGRIIGEYSVYRMRWDSTAGALISNPEDIGRFLKKLMRGRLLPGAQLAEMKKTVTTPGAPPEARGYGLGIAAYEVPGCGLIWFHNGGNPGVQTWASVSDDGRRHYTYSLNMNGFGMSDTADPIDASLDALKSTATRRALCPAR
jgi:D-alanyl-D-alanine carboxypeptidase